MERKVWIDYLKVFAAFAVICIHVSSPYYKEVDPMDAPEWWLANFMNAFSRFCVPIFVMISGSLLLGRDESASFFYKKRALRLIPAIIFWSVFYLLFRYFVMGTNIDHIIADIKSGIILSGRAYYHLWYLSMFLTLMAFVPLLNMWVRGDKPELKHLYLLLGVTALFMGLNQLSSLIDALSTKSFTWFKQAPWFIGYLLLGYLIEKHRDEIKLSNKVLIGTFLLCGTLGMIGNYIAVEKFDVVQDYLILSNTNFLTLIMTLSLFTLFAKNYDKLPEFKFMSALSLASFGIYLIHPVFIKLLSISPMKSYMANGLFYMPFTAVVVFILTALTSLILLRVPYMKKVM